MIRLNLLSTDEDRTNIGAQSYTYQGLGDRVRVVAEYGASANDVKAGPIWALASADGGSTPTNHRIGNRTSNWRAHYAS